MPVAAMQVVTTENVSRHCQMSLGGFSLVSVIGQVPWASPNRLVRSDYSPWSERGSVSLLSATLSKTTLAPSSTHSHPTLLTRITLGRESALWMAEWKGSKDLGPCWVAASTRPATLFTRRLVGWDETFPYCFRWSFSGAFRRGVYQCAQEDFNIFILQYTYL